ncbi:MAG: heme-degrading domain-containing protein [Pseudomonadota bacterium]|nr:heme-degrading domain-containing protein [Pseudomonadota bacterium]
MSVGQDADLARIAVQESRLRFDAFDPDAAWALALALRADALARQAPIVAVIETWAMPLAAFALPGATDDNFDWARRKINVVRRFQRSSYAIGLQLARDGKTLADRGALPERDYAVHGGAFPIFVNGAGCIGAVAVSGLPQRDDHAMVVAALARALGQDPAETALD